MQQAHVDTSTDTAPTSADREQVRRLLLAAPAGMIGAVTPFGRGDDWTPAGVASAIDCGGAVYWQSIGDGHDLVVEIGGRAYRFQVPMPAAVTA